MRPQLRPAEGLEPEAIQQQVENQQEEDQQDEVKESEAADISEVPIETHAPGTYEPTTADVVRVRQIIFKGVNVPVELIDMILDFAEYWPHNTTVLDPGPILSGSGLSENTLLVSLTTIPNPHQPFLVIAN